MPSALDHGSNPARSVAASLTTPFLRTRVAAYRNRTAPQASRAQYAMAAVPSSATQSMYHLLRRNTARTPTLSSKTQGDDSLRLDHEPGAIDEPLVLEQAAAVGLDPDRVAHLQSLRVRLPDAAGDVNLA